MVIGRLAKYILTEAPKLNSFFYIEYCITGDFIIQLFEIMQILFPPVIHFYIRIFRRSPYHHAMIKVKRCGGKGKLKTLNVRRYRP